MTPVALRPATPADSEFCYQLHKAAMRSYVTATWGRVHSTSVPTAETSAVNWLRPGKFFTIS